ncbi:MAG: outer membrane beta-barrel protein [Bacteroidia bacterium]|nr:outer membrane beta-barrel protein [Bacteroidia bacterium]
MKRKILILGFFLFPLLLNAQFEQKVSINLSAGMFKTFGEKHGINEYGESRPKQMPSYKAGIVSELGFQYNINRRFSILAELGIMYSNKWELIEDDEYNWMFWSCDSIYYSEGFNKLNLFNLSIGITPKLYFLPGKKFNPFIYAGININYTHAKYTDTQWEDYIEKGLYKPGDYFDNPWLRKNVGFGFNPGLGIEYNPIEKISVFLTAGYYHIFMNEKNFAYYYPERSGNFNAFLIQAGIKYSFIKSKNL